ncbi:MAG: 50S ribosomal protein L3, partial [Rhodothermales bacterium]|nr:50S ribosomal protein L3 [Rhodothermales bacterium]
MVTGLLGKKLGMTTVFDEAGNQLPCTVIQVDANVVTQVRTNERDHYEAVQLAYGEKKPKRTTKALRGHFEAAGTTPKVKVREFGATDEQIAVGAEIRASDVFEEGEYIDVAGTSKGKGFQG